MFWSEYKDHFLSSLGANGGIFHQSKAGEVLGRFTRYMDPLHVISINQMTYNNYIVRRKQDPGIKRGTVISNTTLNGDKAYLNLAFAWVDSEDGPGRAAIGVPLDWKVPHAKKTKVNKSRRKGFKEEHINRVLESCIHARKPLIPGVRPQDWWLTFWCVDLFTGFRKRAILNLPRPSDQELNSGEIVLSHEWNKSGCDQDTYLPPVLVEWIRHLPSKPGDVLLPWPHGHKCFYDTLHHMQSKAGIPEAEHIMPHGGRALFATGLIKSGASVAIVQQLLGHSTPDLLMRHYLNDVTPEKRQAVDRLPVPVALARTIPSGKDAA